MARKNHIAPVFGTSSADSTYRWGGGLGKLVHVFCSVRLVNPYKLRGNREGLQQICPLRPRHLTSESHGVQFNDFLRGHR